MATPKFPLKWACVGRVIEIYAGQFLNLGRMLGPAITIDKSWRSDRQNPRLNQLACNECSARRFAKSQRQIETIRDQIADMIAHDQFEAHFRVSVEEGRDLRGEHDTREERIDIHAKT